MENVSIATSLVIGRKTALSILKKSRKLKQSEHPSQGLHMRRNLAKGDVDLRVGNGARVAALAVGTYVLSLPRKMTKAPFNGKGERASDLLGLIHSAVCGPMNTQARGGFHYFITFTDDFSRYGYIYLMRHKSEALEKFKEFRNEVQNQHAAFTLNRVPSKSVQKTPHEMWTGKRPNHDEPKTYQEAVSSPDSDKWLEAMRSEMDSMSDNQVWTLVEPPEGIKPIGCKWVLKKKTDMDGNVQTYKGRLVARGYGQIHGIDYDETFSPVAMFKSIRILLAIVAFQDYEIWQMDVKTAFLNGKLEEDMYMTQPEGFVNPENAGKVCKLQRSIYGLKQASRSWNLRFNDAIKEFGFIRNEDEPCVYKKFSGSIVSFLILYVDDILIIVNDIPTLQSVKAWLSSCFSMKDLGKAAYILGVKIDRDRSRRLLGLSQSTYIVKVLKRFNMEASKKGFLPMTHGISLSKEMCPSTSQERERMSQVLYASAIGSIMYAMICTRPDLSYALSMTSRYQANPGEGNWVAVKNILKYLRRTKDVLLVYGGEEQLSIKGYTDASFQTDKDDSRSQSGFVFRLNGASEAAKEAVWIKKFVTELGVVPSISDALELYCDNNGAIAQEKEPKSHQRSKHILRRFHLIREIVDRGDVEICKVHTDDNIADPLTKPLSQQKHNRYTESLGIRCVSDWS
ncbi:hypothetical protein V6N11_001744 [Hibiscus sabdariffa]|uniref:Reverse transcriptase Ty1/copia-type domain-containing protein n=1 Tax=Hibiscus sabdariffa TaxID=183260 RepID=A0ABR2NRM6_9ROSI